MRATRAANCARLPAASNFWGLLAKVRAPSKAEKGRPLRHFLFKGP